MYKITEKGTGRKNYINTIDHDAVRYFIDQIYEPHYAHYKDDFGKLLQDFLMSLKSEALAANMVMMLILENSI